MFLGSAPVQQMDKYLNGENAYLTRICGQFVKKLYKCNLQG